MTDVFKYSILHVAKIRMASFWYALKVYYVVKKVFLILVNVRLYTGHVLQATLLIRLITTYTYLFNVTKTQTLDKNDLCF